MTSIQENKDKETHIVIELKHEKREDEKKPKVNWYQTVNILLIIINLGIAYWGYSNNIKWQQYQQEITDFEPYTRIVSEWIILDTHQNATRPPGTDDNDIFFTGNPEITITVIAPMSCVIEINRVSLDRKINLDQKYDTDNKVSLITPIIEELPPGLSKFTKEITLWATLRMYDYNFPDVGNACMFQVGYITLIGSLTIIPTNETIQISNDFKLEVYLTNPLGGAY